MDTIMNAFTAKPCKNRRARFTISTFGTVVANAEFAQSQSAQPITGTILPTARRSPRAARRTRSTLSQGDLVARR